jgi:hypothetical protein
MSYTAKGQYLVLHLEAAPNIGSTLTAFGVSTAAEIREVSFHLDFDALPSRRQVS